MPESLLFPHELVGHDHLSVNIFQQQPWWGPDVASLMDETFAAKAFFGRPDGFTPHPAGLLDIDGTSLTAGQWAQAVQKSAYPDAYDRWQPVAQAVVGKVEGITCTSTGLPAAGPVVADSTWASVIALERSRLGTPYSWGGGTVNGPGLGFGPGAGVVGWDCSSFQQWAIYEATGGKVDITRTTTSQTTKGQGTPFLFMKGPPLQPGDLLYWGDGSTSHHVALYSGDGMMLEETHPGSAAQENPLRPDYTAVLRLDLTALSAS